MSESKTPNRNGDVIDWAALGEEARKPSKLQLQHFDPIGVSSRGIFDGVERFPSIDRDTCESHQEMLDEIFANANLTLGVPAYTYADRSPRSDLEDMHTPYSDLSDKYSAFMQRIRERLFRPEIKTWPEGAAPTERTEMILVRYKNWRGEVRERHIKPLALVHGSTKWHKEPQWLVRAIDPEDGTKKSFALRDCDFTPASRQTPPWFTFNYQEERVVPHMHAAFEKYSEIDRRRHSDPERGGFKSIFLGRHHTRAEVHPKVAELANLFFVMLESFEYELVTCEFRPRDLPNREHLPPELRSMAHAHIQILRTYMYARTTMYGFEPRDFDEAVRDLSRKWRPEAARRTPEGSVMKILGMVVNVLRWPFQNR